MYDSFKLKDKRWARTTSECESGGNPDAIGGGGSTAARSSSCARPGRLAQEPGRRPVAYPYKTQAVVAVLLMHRDGAGHWPVCG